MPTGYTAKLYDGKDQTFAEFAMSCARGFGALITMRDEPADAEIPEKFEPSSYHSERLEEARREYSCWQTLSDAEADRLAGESFEEAVASYAKAEADREDRRRRYEQMLDKVRGWTPPTEEHKGLRDFMEKQLLESIDFDCGRLYRERPVRLPAADYRADQLTRYRHEIEYHTRELAREIERVEGRTRWVRELRESLA